MNRLRTVKRASRIAAIHLIVSAFVLILVAPAASAISYYLPQQTDPPQQSYVFLAIGRLGKNMTTGSGNTLPAPSTSVKFVFVKHKPDAVTIYDGGYCKDSPVDNHNEGVPCGNDPNNDTTYTFQAFDNETGAAQGSPITVLGSQMMAGPQGNPTQNDTYTVDLSGLAAAAPSSDGNYFVNMTATWTRPNAPSCKSTSPPPCYSGTNTFIAILKQTTDFATYPATDTNASALAVIGDRRPSDPYPTSDIKFEFAPKCNSSALNRKLIWEDADVGAPSNNQKYPLSWKLFDDTDPANIKLVDSMSGNALGGDGSHKEVSEPWQLNHKYRWVWYGVDDGNGLNVFLPFDGYNYVAPCGSITPPPPPPPPGPPPSQTSPYFNVTGGDVSVGQGMSLGGSDCSTGVAVHNQASIVGWNRGSANGYGGANTQYGAFALNHLQEFSTAQNGNRPTGLAFANTLSTAGVRVEPSNGLYGGGFAGGSCINYYYGDATNPAAGNQLLTNLGLPAGGNIPNGATITYYVNGSLYINSNVRYSGNYPTTGDIPHFKVVVRGNIYIDKAVNQLDGIYVAEPTGPTTNDGNIYTCAINNAFTPLTLTTQLVSNCGTALTINGAIVSRQLWLMRTGGDVTSTPAETVNYLPELWVGTKPATTGNGGEYDAITGLPPVL